MASQTKLRLNFGLFCLAVLVTPLCTSSAPILIGYTNAVAVDSLPVDRLTQAAGFKWFFAHASVGDNIMNGVVSLHAGNVARYGYSRSSVGGAPPGTTTPGVIYDFQRGNPGWQPKVDDFATYVGNGWCHPRVDIVLNKFCWIDPDANLDYYVTSMSALENANSQTRFVYATIPLTPYDEEANYRRSLFNNGLRAWVRANNKILYDIADIEAHAPNGVEQTFMYSGYRCQKQYAGYTSDGGHLTTIHAQENAAKGLYAVAVALLAAPPPDPSTNPPPIAAFINAQPEDRYCVSGKAATFFVDADGSGDLFYQWHKDGAPLVNGGRISGARSATLTVSDVQLANSGSYFVVVSNAYGFAVSSNARLEIISPKQTFSLPDYYFPIYPGNRWVYDEESGGSGKMVYQVQEAAHALTCYRGRSSIRTYTRDAVSLSCELGESDGSGSFTPTNSWNDYMIADGDTWGFMGSDSGTRQMRLDPGFLCTKRVPIGFTSTWTNDVYINGVYRNQATLKFQVVEYASINGPAGAYPECLHIRRTLVQGGVTQSNDEWWAKGVGMVKTICRVTKNGLTSSKLYQLDEAAFVAPPRIIIQPKGVVCPVGSMSNLFVEVMGSGTLSYQWRKNGSDLSDGSTLSGTTTDTLLFADFLPPDVGGYCVVVSNPYGSVTSAVAAVNLTMGRDGDDFNDRVRDTSKWSVDVYPEALGGQLLETNGRLEFRGSAPALRKWMCSVGTYTQDWEVFVDVNVGEVPLTINGSEVAIGLCIGNLDSETFRNGLPGDCLDLTLRLQRDEFGQLGRHVRAALNAGEGESIDGNEIQTLTRTASLRITFSGADKTLTAWYDEDGSVNGYAWTALFWVSEPSTGWGMNENSRFRLAILGDSNGYKAGRNQLYAENFVVRQAMPSFADGIRPGIAITSPLGRIDSGLVDVQGWVKENDQVNKVRVSINQAEFQPASLNNDTNWVVPAQTLTPGTNRLRAYAVDASGNRSGTNVQTVFYAVTNQLTVQTSGQGTIKPNYNGKWLEIGRGYSMVATGWNGHVFGHWALSTDGNNWSTSRAKQLKFLMQSNLVIVANFDDVQLPKLTVTAPLANARVSNPIVTVRGKASDNAGISAVYYRLNSGDWFYAAGTTNWTADLTLAAGTNVLRAYVEDSSGNRSGTNRQNIILVSSQSLAAIPAPLRLSLGESAGPSGVTVLVSGEVGRSYEILASPDLTHWEILAVVLNTNGVAEFTDTNPPPGPRFYRAILKE